MNTSNVFHITGPPGTGKTEFLARATRDAVQLRGRRVAIASLTNAAAAEIRDRTGVRDESMVAVGTLHKLAMGALGVGRDDLVASHLSEWNEGPGRGDWKLTGEDSPEEGRRAQETAGDRFMGILEDHRQRMAPLPAAWESLRAFCGAYAEWKSERGLLDFTDIIERAALETSTPAVGGETPDTLVLDECQDSTRLELHLVREVWGRNVERVILAGDPDQTLYSFRSADPRVFLDFPVPDGHAKTLGQSYRVPRAVQRYAQALIRRIRDRVDVSYSPRDEEGEVLRSDVSLRWPDRLLRDLPSWLDEGTVMLLGATQYAVAPLLPMLRAEGIPYANPWATKRGDWNPLRPARKGTLSTVQRFLAYLAPGRDEWTTEDLLQWMPLLASSGLLARGVQKDLASRLSDPWTSAEIVSLFQREEDLIEAYTREPAWLVSRVKAAKRAMVAFLARVHARGGAAALVDPPRLLVGTIHSVKGAAADTVVVFPDVTPAMYRAQASRAGMEDQTRTFYVAATRARRRLVLARAAGPRAYAT